MRVTYHVHLEQVITDLVSMSEAAAKAIREATRALLTADLETAEAVISSDIELDEQLEDIETRCFELLARQAPVAGELRTIVAAIRMAFELARTADLAVHVAKVARLRYPEKAIPEALTQNMARMAEIANTLVTTAGNTLRDRDVSKAETMAEADAEVDELRRKHFDIILDDSWPYGVTSAVDVALVGRYYERMSDHAVATGRRIIFLVTGEAPEGEDWPNA